MLPCCKVLRKSVYMLFRHLLNVLYSYCRASSIEKEYKEWTRMVNFLKLGGGVPLCTLHRAEGLHGWVTRRGYMRDSLLKSLSGRLYRRGPL